VSGYDPKLVDSKIYFENELDLSIVNPLTPVTKKIKEAFAMFSKDDKYIVKPTSFSLLSPTSIKVKANVYANLDSKKSTNDNEHSEDDFFIVINTWGEKSIWQVIDYFQVGKFICNLFSAVLIDCVDNKPIKRK